MCPCNSGVSGLGIDIDWTKIGVEQAKEIITKLPEGDVMSIIRSLPMDIQRKICAQGVTQEATSYIPYIVGYGAVFLVGYMLLKK